MHLVRSLEETDHPAAAGGSSGHEAGTRRESRASGMRRRPRRLLSPGSFARASPSPAARPGTKSFAQRNTVESIGSSRGFSRVASTNDAEHLVCFPFVPGRTAVDAYVAPCVQLRGLTVQQVRRHRWVPPASE